MGPLVPDIISEEFNFIVAFLVGILFGFALEQAGFSSTKKLVGLFYGYDFTVLKVFFTAGVTAMVGVLVLTHVGLLDMRYVYVNPTFVQSAIVGGVIMGAGFIIGGFCPGTSLCAAAVGKIDAWAFIGGSMIGILAFTEGYPFLEDLYLAQDLGGVTIYDALNVAPETFAFVLAAVAIAAFYFTGLIEDKVNGLQTQYPARKVLRYATVALVPFLLVSFISFSPNRQEYLFDKAETELQTKTVRIYPVDKLAADLIYNGTEINLIDVRAENTYQEFNIPTAINIPLENILNKEYSYIFQQQYKVNIFYGADEGDAKKAAMLAGYTGNAENYALDSTPEQFKKMFYEQEIPGANASQSERDLFRYRLKAGIKLKEIEDRLKSLREPVKKEVKKAKGGCS